MKLYYVANARMPNEKAHGIQIAQMCEAFLERGVELVLVVPGRSTHKQSLKEFYGLSCDVPLVKIPTLNLYHQGRVGFVVSSFLFMLFAELFLWSKKIRGEKFSVYTIDMDNFSYSMLPLAGATFTEMHTPKHPSWLQRFFFARVRGIIATNRLIRQRFVDDYHLLESRVISEPNGVDFKRFASAVPQEEAREKLSLPKDKKIVLYVGRFYQWKGLDILGPACEKLPEHIVCYVVGGAKEEFLKTTGVPTVPANIIFAGERPVDEIPMWLQAADALLVLGTNTNEDSSKYTSPMKLFEYMASNKTIVASATPAVSDVLTQEDAFLYEPDNAVSLARVIETAVSSSDSVVKAKRAQIHAHSLTWDMRAERILAFIARADTLK